MTINKQYEYRQGFSQNKLYKISEILLGLVNYYGHLIANLINKVLSLAELSRPNQRSKCLTISNEERAAYIKIKETHSAATALPHSVPIFF